MRLRIKSTGPTSAHVTVLDADTGKVLEGVSGVRVSVGRDAEGAHTFNEATLVLEGAELDVEAVYSPEPAVEAAAAQGETRATPAEAPYSRSTQPEAHTADVVRSKARWAAEMGKHCLVLIDQASAATLLQAVEDLFDWRRESGLARAEQLGQPFACARQAEGGFVCQSDLDLDEAKGRLRVLLQNNAQLWRSARCAPKATVEMLRETVRRQADRIALLETSLASEQSLAEDAHQRLTEADRTIRHWRANAEEQLRRKRAVQGLYSEALDREVVLIREAEAATQVAEQL